MANRFTVWTDLKVRGTGLNREVSKTKKAFLGLDKSVKNVGISLRTVFAGAGIATGIATIGFGIRSVTEDIIEMDHALTGASARWGPDFARGTKGFDDLSASARKVAADTEFMGQETAKGLDFFARAGLKASTAIALLPEVADFATAANFDFAESADIATDALGAFGRNTGTTEQKVGAFREIMDQAAKTANMANMDVGMWFETLKKVGPASVTAGQDMKQLNAVMGILAGSGIKAETAGVQLRQALTRLADPTAKGRAALKQLGTSVKDEFGNFRDFSDIIGDLKKGTEKLGEVKKAQLMARIFGVRQVSAIKVLFDAGKEGIEGFAEQIENSDGYVKQLATTMRGSLQNRIKKVKSMFTELGFKAFDAFGPHLEKGIKAVTEWLEDANKNSKGWMKTVVKLGDTLADVAKWIVENREMVLALGKAYLGFKAAGVISNVVDLGTSWAGVTTEIKGATDATKGFAGIMGKVNAGAIGLTLGLAIGNAIWQVLEAKAKQREARALARQNKAVKDSKNLAKQIKHGNLYQLQLAEKAVRGKDRWKGLDLEQVEKRVAEGKTKGYGSELLGDVELLKRARARRAALLENMRLGRGGGMFGTDFTNLPQTMAGKTPQGMTSVNPSFDVFVTNNIDKEGNTQSTVTVEPKAPGLPAPNPAGIMP